MIFNARNRPVTLEQLGSIKVQSFSKITHQEALEHLDLIAAILRVDFDDPASVMAEAMAQLVRNFRVHPSAATDFIHEAYQVVENRMRNIQ